MLNSTLQFAIPLTAILAVEFVARVGDESGRGTEHDCLRGDGPLSIYVYEGAVLAICEGVEPAVKPKRIAFYIPSDARIVIAEVVVVGRLY